MTNKDGSIVGVVVVIESATKDSCKSKTAEFYAVHNSPTFLFGFKTKNRLKYFMSECHDNSRPSIHVEKLAL